jgi:hypothetical protein
LLTLDIVDFRQLLGRQPELAAVVSDEAERRRLVNEEAERRRSAPQQSPGRSAGQLSKASSDPASAS